MNINKASWVTDGDNVRLSMPFGKVDQERRLVSGFASLDNVDKQMDIVTTEASMSAFAKFRGNIREMHQPSAVGKMISFKEEKYFDPESKKFYKGVYVSTYISKGAQDAWEKVLDGTYTGFSIGGRMNKWDDAYDDTMEKQIRIIKDYDLIELSLVDSPANQFASIMSVEKVDGVDMIKADNTVLENVFYDKESGLVIVSEEETQVSPATGQEMKNIGFVEKDDLEKANMIKFLVDSAKGISTIKITKEVNPMTEATEVAVESAVEEVEVTPEAQPAVVQETPAVVEEAPAAEKALAVESSDGSAESSVAPAAETVENTADKADSLDANATASNEEIAKAVSDIKDSLTNAFGDLASTVKSLHEQIMTLSKSLESVTSEVKEVKGTFDEIVQFEPLKVQKSLWGGRFLTSTDLFN
jgi:hypothetical protein